MPSDARGELHDGRYEYRAQKEGRVVISWYGRPVSTLTGQEAQKFLARIPGLGDHDAQLLMARLTGNFKRGNERRSGRGR